MSRRKKKNAEVGQTVRPTGAKTPRRDGNRKLPYKAIEKLAPAIDKLTAKHAPRLGGLMVNYCYTFHTSWTGDLKRYTKEDIQKWEAERLLYNIILMDSKRFQIHVQKSNSLRVRNTVKGTTISYTVLQQVYLEFTDNQRTVPVEDLIHYTDPLLLLDEMGVKH